MSSPGMPWVKIWTDFIHDPKIGRLPPTAQLLFVKLLVMAGECDAEGYLMDGEEAMTPEDIAYHLHVDLTQLNSDLEKLKLGPTKLIEEDAGYLFIVNFSKRQGRPQSERRAGARERQKRYRESHKNINEQGNSVTRESRVTDDDGHALVTPLEGEREGEESKRESKSGARPEAGNAPAASKLSPIKAQNHTPPPNYSGSTATPEATPTFEAAHEEIKADVKPVKPRDLLFDAIAEVTCSNPKLQGSRIAKCAKELRAISATPEQVHQVFNWYSQNDWRGRKGEKLTFAVLAEVWELGMQNKPVRHSANGNGHASPPAMRGESAGDAAMRRLAEKYSHE